MSVCHPGTTHSQCMRSGRESTIPSRDSLLCALPDVTCSLQARSLGQLSPHEQEWLASEVSGAWAGAAHGGPLQPEAVRNPCVTAAQHAFGVIETRPASLAHARAGLKAQMLQVMQMQARLRACQQVLADLHMRALRQPRAQHAGQQLGCPCPSTPA